jgi:hypothetical protein
MFSTSYFLSLPYVSISVPQAAYADVSKQLLRISSFSGRFEELHRYDLNMTYARYIAVQKFHFEFLGSISPLFFFVLLFFFFFFCLFHFTPEHLG